MKRKLLAGVCVVMFGISGMAYSDDTTVTLDGNTSGSGFSIKDSSGTSIARFQGDGKVGIGTTGPNYGLHIKSDDGSTGWVLKTESSNSTNDGVVLLGSRSDNDGAIQSLNNVGGASDLAINPDGGNVGIGTTNPNYKLDVRNSIGVANTDYVLGSAGSLLTIGMGASSGNTYASFDSFTDGATAFGNIVFHPTGNGNVGIGTTNPNGKLSVVAGSDTYSASFFGNSTSNQVRLGMYGSVAFIGANNNDGSAWTDFVINPGGGNVGVNTQTTALSYTLQVNGSAYSTGGWSGSDERWKKDVHPLENSLSNVLKLQGVSYLWKTEEYPNNCFSEDRQIGLIAQEVEKVIPELVHTDNEGYKSVSYEKLTAVLIDAVKEQQKLIVQQQKENEMQQKQIEELKEMMNNAIQLASVK